MPYDSKDRMNHQRLSVLLALAALPTSTAGLLAFTAPSARPAPARTALHSTPPSAAIRQPRHRRHRRSRPRAHRTAIVHAPPPTGRRTHVSTVPRLIKISKFSPVPRPQATAAILGARTAYQRLITAQTAWQLAESLSNESAMIPALSLYRRVSTTIGDTPSAHPSSPAMAPIRRELVKLKMRWGVSSDITLLAAPLFRRNGRRFLHEVTLIAADLDHLQPQHWPALPPLTLTWPATSRRFAFAVITPTQVLIDSHDAGLNLHLPRLAAVFEDGRWRIDLGSLDAGLAFGLVSFVAEEPASPPHASPGVSNLNR